MNDEVKTLKELRLARLLTLRALAERAGVQVQTVNRAELGTRIPALRTIKAISGALGVDPMTVREFRASMGVRS